MPQKPLYPYVIAGKVLTSLEMYLPIPMSWEYLMAFIAKMKQERIKTTRLETEEEGEPRQGTSRHRRDTVLPDQAAGAVLPRSEAHRHRPLSCRTKSHCRDFLWDPCGTQRRHEVSRATNFAERGIWQRGKVRREKTSGWIALTRPFWGCADKNTIIIWATSLWGSTKSGCVILSRVQLTVCTSGSCHLVPSKHAFFKA